MNNRSLACHHRKWDIFKEGVQLNVLVLHNVEKTSYSTNGLFINIFALIKAYSVGCISINYKNLIFWCS